MTTEIKLVKSKFNKQLIVKTDNEDVKDIICSLLCFSYDINSGLYFIPIPELYMVHFLMKKMNLSEVIEIEDEETEKEINKFKEKFKKLKIIREDKENQQTFDFPWKKVQKHLKTELFKDQWSACAFIYYCEGYGVINYSMGLGKSLISIAYALYLKHVTKTSKRALIFCPNIVKSSWSKELGKHTYEKYTTIENGSELVLKNLDDYLKSDNYFLVVHYDAIKTRTTKNKKTKKTETEDRIINFIIDKIKPNIIIVDESHILKNIATKVTNSAIKAFTSEKVESVIFTTGTIMEKTPLDTYITQLICLPEVITTKDKYEDFFTLKKEKRLGKKVVHEIYGYKNLAYFRIISSLFSIRRSKKDVPGMIPEALMYRDIELTTYQKKLVKDIKKIAQGIKEGLIQSGHIDELNVEEIKQTFIRMRQISNNPALLGGKNESAKYDLCEEILEEILSDDYERVLIFTDFKEAVGLLGEKLKKWNPILVDGTETENKQQLIDRLENRDLNHRILISTPYRIGIGCSFSRTSYIIYVDKPQSSIVYKQSNQRIVRRDSEGQVATRISLMATYNGNKFTDHSIENMLKRKERTHDAFIESKDYILDKWDITDIANLLNGVFPGFNL